MILVPIITNFILSFLHFLGHLISKGLFHRCLTQAGIFKILNVPEEGMEMVLAITCPNILFPYAREAISDLIVKAGFSSVLLNPINFEALYMQKKEEEAAKKAGNAN